MIAPNRENKPVLVPTIRRVRLSGRWWLVDLGDMALAIGIVAVSVWYLSDALRASQAFQNLILIVPLSIFIFILCALVLATAVAPESRERRPGSVLRRAPAGFQTLGLMVLFALYVATLPVLGFDVGTALFCAGCVLVQGGRNLLGIAFFSGGMGLLMGVIMAFGPIRRVPLLLFN